MKNAQDTSLLVPKYGRIARVYRWLEYAAFGPALQRSRETFLDRLSDRREIAVFGGGDGRCFAPLLRAAPNARIHAFDVDPVMLRLAQSRVEALSASKRVNFQQIDARSWEAPSKTYDAVVAQYFLDCFTAEELDLVIPKIAHSLLESALWIFADFAIPEQPGFARFRARLMIGLLCRFFQWQVDHPLRTLPPMAAKLREHGFSSVDEKLRWGGMIRSAVYRRIR